MKLVSILLLHSGSFAYALTCQSSFDPILKLGDGNTNDWLSSGSPHCKGKKHSCKSSSMCLDLHGDCDTDSECLNLCFKNSIDGTYDYCGTCDLINEGQPHGSLANGARGYCSHDECPCQHSEGDCISSRGLISNYWSTDDNCQIGHHVSDGDHVILLMIIKVIYILHFQF